MLFACGLILTGTQSFAADVRIKAGTFTTPATTGVVSVDTVGFTPKAVILYGVPVQNESVNVDSAFYVGFAADGTAANQKVTKVSGQNGASNTERQQDEARVLSILTAPSTTPVVLATLSSFDADGFNLNYSSTSSGYVVHYIAFGGADLQAVTGQEAANTSPVSGLPFQPNLVFVMSSGLSAGTATESWMDFRKVEAETNGACRDHGCLNAKRMSP